MIGERTAEGYELRLTSKGIGRYVGAAFLSVWLCGWAVGEAFALGFLTMGVRHLLTGEPGPDGHMPLEGGPALVSGIFVLVWLTFWTLGGVMAIRELLFMLWGEDRIVASADGLAVSHRRGPFHSGRRIPRDQLRGVRLRGRSGLVAETSRAVVALSRLGTPAERQDAVDVLRRELGLQEVARTGEAGLPEGWEEALTPEGERVLVSSPRTRRQQAVVTGLIAVAAAGAACAVLGRALAQLSVLPLALVLCAVAAAVTWGAMWLGRGRVEWRIGGGRITQRRRYGSKVRDVFEGQRLELDTARDSDGDAWYHLDLVSAAEPAAAPGLRVSRKTRRRVASSMRDAETPRRLGQWLAARADVPLVDRTSPERRAAELAALRAQLEQAGPLGRLAGRLLDEVQPDTEPGGTSGTPKP